MNAIELKCRREALGLSRDALADTLGVAEKSITRWEFGKNPPRDVEGLTMTHCVPNERYVVTR